MRVLIVGCGYVGLPLGAELVRQGHEVFGVRRTAAAADQLLAAGIKPLTADITQPQSLATLPRPFDWVVNCAASTKGGVNEYEQVYLEGTRNLLRWLRGPGPQGRPAEGSVTPQGRRQNGATDCAWDGLRKYVQTSSTGVYAQTDGSAVSELSPTEPATPTSRVLAATEALLLRAARTQSFPAVILRVAGIYGPDRTYWLGQLLQNEARIEGDGRRLLNMIHRDDVVGAIMAALTRGRPGEIYNAVDDEPRTQVEFLSWLAGRLGRPTPPRASETPDSPRKRGLTSKKVLNHKLRSELKYRFKYPSFREGYSAELQRRGRV